LSRGSRPIGVTVISILMIANAALLVGGGIFIILVIPGVINEQLAGNQTNITIGSQTIGNVGKTATSLIHAIIIGVSTVSVALGVGAFVSIGVIEWQGLVLDDFCDTRNNICDL